MFFRNLKRKIFIFMEVGRIREDFMKKKKKKKAFQLVLKILKMSLQVKTSNPMEETACWSVCQGVHPGKVSWWVSLKKGQEGES